MIDLSDLLEHNYILTLEEAIFPNTSGEDIYEAGDRILGEVKRLRGEVKRLEAQVQRLTR